MSPFRFPGLRVSSFVYDRLLSGDRRVRLLTSCLLLAAALLATSPAAHAQEFGRIEETKSTVAYFYHAETGEATIQVAVWGSVGRTGIYEIPVDTDLERLMTMAGGAPLDARSEDQIQETTIRLYRVTNDQREVIYEQPLEEMVTRPGNYPNLEDGDIMVVETITDRRFGFRDVLSLVSTLGTLTLLGLRLFGRRR